MVSKNRVTYYSTQMAWVTAYFRLISIDEPRFELQDPLSRATAYLNAYEDALAGQSLEPAELLKLFTTGLSTSKMK